MRNFNQLCVSGSLIMSLLQRGDPIQCIRRSCRTRLSAFVLLISFLFNHIRSPSPVTLHHCSLLSPSARSLDTTCKPALCLFIAAAASIRLLPTRSIAMASPYFPPSASQATAYKPQNARVSSISSDVNSSHQTLPRPRPAYLPHIIWRDETHDTTTRVGCIILDARHTLILV